jgi:hypothetical protein
LSHEQSVPSPCQIVAQPSRRRFRDPKKPQEKNFKKIPRNPLISLDLDERIQGNPSFSNPHNLGFSSEKATIQENPNPIDLDGLEMAPLRASRTDSIQRRSASSGKSADGQERPMRRQGALHAPIRTSGRRIETSKIIQASGASWRNSPSQGSYRRHRSTDVR